MVWMYVWMFVVLKIPVVAAFYLVWWSTREVEQTDEPADDGGRPGGGDPRPSRPRPPRRGPHAGPPPRSPRRVRVAARTNDPSHR